MSTQQFRPAADLKTPEFEASLQPLSTGYMRLVGGRLWSGWFMSVEQATRLRDWLNRVLPEEDYLARQATAAETGRDPNGPFRWICPKCSTVNGIQDDICLGGSCGMHRP